MQTIDLARVAFALALGYLLGGIPFGIIVPRLIGGPDPRTIGSGRTGGANVSRAVGYRWAAVSGLLDVAKAAVAVLIVIAVGGNDVARVAAALAAIIGHSRSPFIAMSGGRGVAPATGGALVLEPLLLAAMLPVFIITILLTRISSIGSLSASAVGGVGMVVATAVLPLPPIYFVYGVGGAGLIWLFHLDNIQRLLAGKERRIGPKPAGASDADGADGGPGDEATEGRP
jgi:glycerol-3-phosphate acyltransferase PlsY